MKWTTEKPKVGGWYWMMKNREFQFEASSVPRIEFLREYSGKMCILNWEIPEHAKWAGPIPEPEEG